MPGDDRDANTVRTDLLVDQVTALVAKFDEVLRREGAPTTQTVIQQHQGVPALLTAAAIGVCFGSMLFSIAIAVWCFNISAWQDVFRGKIAKIEAQLQPAQPPRN